MNKDVEMKMAYRTKKFTESLNKDMTDISAVYYRAGFKQAIEDFPQDKLVFDCTCRDRPFGTKFKETIADLVLGFENKVSEWLLWVVKKRESLKKQKKGEDSSQRELKFSESSKIENTL